MDNNKEYVVVEFPEVQDISEKEGFFDNARLINGEKGLATYGGSAYLVDKEWLTQEHKDVTEFDDNGVDIDEIYDYELEQLGFL